MNVVKKPISQWSAESSSKRPFLPPNILGINYRNRLGALEVQMYAKWQGKTSQHILHSKLLSGRWPNLSVVTDISHAIFKNLMNHNIMDKRNSSDFADNYLSIDESLVLDTTTTSCNVNSPEHFVVGDDKPPNSIMAEETILHFDALDIKEPLSLTSLENVEAHNLKSTLHFDAYNSDAIPAIENKNVNTINISEKESESSFAFSNEELNSNDGLEEEFTTIIHDDKSIISGDLKTSTQIDPVSEYKKNDESNIKNQKKQEILTPLLSENSSSDGKEILIMEIKLPESVHDDSPTISTPVLDANSSQNLDNFLFDENSLDGSFEDPLDELSGEDTW